MPSKTIDKTGKVVRQTPATRPHPDGNRARTADGRVFDDQGRPVGTEPKPKTPAAPPPAEPGD